MQGQALEEVPSFPYIPRQRGRTSNRSGNEGDSEIEESEHCVSDAETQDIQKPKSEQVHQSTGSEQW